MMADGLIKALGTVHFKRFTEMVGLEDLTERLMLIQYKDELKEQLTEMKSQEKTATVAFAHSRDLRYEP
jgi:hypothetical protein